MTYKEIAEFILNKMPEEKRNDPVFGVFEFEGCLIGVRSLEACNDTNEWDISKRSDLTFEMD